MDQSKNAWIAHVEFFVLLISLLGGFVLLNARIETQNSRTDKLYEMFCTLQKESDQKFYDLLKESKG